MVTVDQLSYGLNILITTTILFVLFKVLVGTTKKNMLIVICSIIITTGVTFYVGNYGKIVAVFLLFIVNITKAEKGFLLLFNVLLTSVISTCSIFLVSSVITLFISIGKMYGIVIIILFNVGQLITGLLLCFMVKRIIENWPINPKILPFLCLLLLKIDIVFMIYIVIGQSMKILALFATGTFLFMVFEFLFFIASVLIVWQKLKKSYDQQLEQENFKNLNDYTQQLELKQLKLSKFKHDYQNLLLSIKNISEIEEEIDWNSYLTQLKSYSNEEFNNCEMSFSDIRNIQSPLVKSLLLNKFLKWKEVEINFSFECQELLENKQNIDFELIRILGILLDNAYEEILENRGKLNLLLFQIENTVEIIIENTCEKKLKSFSELSEKNYTSKENHQGLGLTIVNDLIKKRKDVFIQQEQRNQMFIVKLIIIESERGK